MELRLRRDVAGLASDCCLAAAALSSRCSTIVGSVRAGAAGRQPARERADSGSSPAAAASVVGSRRLEAVEQRRDEAAAHALSSHPNRDAGEDQPARRGCSTRRTTTPGIGAEGHPDADLGAAAVDRVDVTP